MRLSRTDLSAARLKPLKSVRPPFLSLNDHLRIEDIYLNKQVKQTGALAENIEEEICDSWRRVRLSEQNDGQTGKERLARGNSTRKDPAKMFGGLDGPKVRS